VVSASKPYFVFIEHHISGQVTEVFRQRLSRAFEEEFELNYQDYCIFLPQMESTVFAGTAAIADVFLDSIAWSGGNTTLEAIAHNIPVVTFLGDLMHRRHTMAMLKMMSIEETIAANKEEYVQGDRHPARFGRSL
jgi:protein O-GlcNAc transferase